MGFPVTPSTYTCEECEQTFVKGWSDEDAKAEAEGNFPGWNGADAAIVCDDCYKAIMAGIPPTRRETST